MAADAAALFAAYQHRLFRYFCRAVGQTETARDLTQDVFLRVSRTAIPEAADGEVRAWLFQIARNLALDHHRKRLRQPEPSVLADEGSRSPSQDVDLAVHAALAALADLDRDVFLMREVAGLGYEEIGRACGLTRDAVRSRIHRARLQLGEALAAPIATRRTIPMRQSGRQARGWTCERYTRSHLGFSGRRTVRFDRVGRGAQRTGGTRLAHRPDRVAASHADRRQRRSRVERPQVVALFAARACRSGGDFCCSRLRGCWLVC